MKFVAAARDQQGEEEIDHLGDHGLGLADAHGLDNDHVKACRLAQQHGLAGLARHPAQSAARRRGSDEGIWIDAELLHPGLVAEDRTAGPAARRVHGQHGDLVPCCCKITAQSLDGGRFASPWHASDPDALGLARQGHEDLQHLPGQHLMVHAVAFDQGDGPRQSGSLTGGDGGREGLRIG